MPPPLRLSNSKANTFRRCQRQFHYKYRLKLKPKERALPLFRGDWLHQLLMAYHDNVIDWRELHADLKARNWDNLLQEEKEDLGGNLPEEVERLFKGYRAHYREEDRHWHTVDTEIDEVVTLPNGMELNIIIDRIAEDLRDHSVWIWDYKTVSRFFPPEFLLLDAQLALYFWSAEKRLGIRNLRGAMLDELITKPPTLPKALKTGGFERRKNLHCDAFTYFAVLKQAGLDPADYRAFLNFLRSRHHEWWRRTPLPRDEAMVKRVVQEMMATGRNIESALEDRVFPRTARKECTFDCSFLEICQAQLQGADIDHIVKIKYQRSKRPEQEDMKKLWPTQMKGRRGNGKGTHRS